MFKILLSICGIITMILVIGFFGFVCKEYNNPKKDPYQSQTPVLDKFQKDTEKIIQTNQRRD